MSCKIDIPFSGNPDELMERVRREATNYQAVFNGDTNSGNFSVNAMGSLVEGNYIVQGQIIQINITTKPFMIPCSMIGSFLKSHIK